MSILLGHSYAGMVISGVIDRAPERISTAIYCDAYVPDNGQSCFDLTNDVFRKLFLDGAAEDGFSVPPRPGADPRTTPHPLAAFLQRLHLTNTPPQIRRVYICLSGWPDTPFTSVYERLRRAPDWQTFDLPVRHDVIAAAFDELLENLLRFT